MKQIIFFILFLVPMVGQACQWKVKVTNVRTNELKYYLADSTEPTAIMLAGEDNQPIAICSAQAGPDTIKKEEHKKILISVETGVIG